MPKGTYSRGEPAWARTRIRQVSANALQDAYRAQVALLRAAGEPATAGEFTDRMRGALVKRICVMRDEMRRRHLLPQSMWAACDE